MNLQEMLDQAATGDVHVEEGWGQGRATFGGLVGGLLVSALLPQVPEGAWLRSLTVNFVAPVAPGEARADVEVLRSGKSATQVLGTLRQEGAPVAVALGAFGSSRESAVRVEPTVTCSNCGTAGLVGDWQGEFGNYFTDCAVALWNWPPLSLVPGLDAELLRAIGPRPRIVYAHM